ncbi:MAG: hypothetical protein KKA44_09070, partial [Alphaproteobacteria bacterium]|nr:hypothetical protein [Alphaproteobacteria bacterium]
DLLSLLDDASVSFIALNPPFHVGAAVYEGVAARLRLSKAQRLALARYATPWPQQGSARQVAATVQPIAQVRQWLLLRGDADTLRAQWAALEDWDAPEFPVSGRHILAMGIDAGPSVARVLGETRRRWIAEDFPGEPRAHEIAQAVARELG